jgi:hypothetical protein
LGVRLAGEHIIEDDSSFHHGVTSRELSEHAPEVQPLQTGMNQPNRSKDNNFRNQNNGSNTSKSEQEKKPCTHISTGNVVFALVNDDLAQLPSSKGPSRGQLVLSMLNSETSLTPEAILKQFPLSNMVGFRLHRFSLERAEQWHWNGVTLSHRVLPHHSEVIASSSLDQTKAQHVRSEQLSKSASSNLAMTSFQQFSQEHQRALTPLMSRPDAETVSLTQIHMDAHQTIWHHLNQPLNLEALTAPWTQDPHTERTVFKPHRA